MLNSSLVPKFLISFVLASQSSLSMAQSEARICPTCLPLNDGDFFHRSDALSPGWIGHAGIKLTPKNGSSSAVYDFNTGRPKGKALQGISFLQWLDGREYWGAKRSSRMDLRRLNMLSARLFKLLNEPTEYDGNHLNQKGESMKGVDGRTYFEADCVGFVEGLHEETRDDLTPDANEGPILFVTTQRDLSFSFDVKR